MGASVVDWDQSRGPSGLVVEFGAGFESCGGPIRLLVGFGVGWGGFGGVKGCKGIQVTGTDCDGSDDRAGMWWD